MTSRNFGRFLTPLPPRHTSSQKLHHPLKMTSQSSDPPPKTKFPWQSKMLLHGTNKESMNILKSMGDQILK